MHDWLPQIQYLLPGSGLTPFNVLRLSVDWWLEYVSVATSIIDANKKATQSASNRAASQQRGRR